MSMTLSSLRLKRDAIEKQELEERNEAIRAKLLPLMLQDIQGQLAEKDGLTLLECCDDLELDEASYAELCVAAKSIAADHRAMEDLKPEVADEHILFAQNALARRKSEALLEQALKADKKQKRLKSTIASYSKQLEIYQDRFPALFDDCGQPVTELFSLPAREQPVEAKKTMSTCPICGTEFEKLDSVEYCGGKCQHLARVHAVALEELAILTSKKGKRS